MLADVGLKVSNDFKAHMTCANIRQPQWGTPQNSW